MIFDKAAGRSCSSVLRQATKDGNWTEGVFWLLARLRSARRPALFARGARFTRRSGSPCRSWEPRGAPAEPAALAAAAERLEQSGGVLDSAHMANVGKHLFTEHMISVELAGTLLLAALVGAVAMAIQGKPRLAAQIEEALR
jgi:hypothetical protein